MSYSCGVNASDTTVAIHLILDCRLLSLCVSQYRASRVRSTSLAIQVTASQATLRMDLGSALLPKSRQRHPLQHHHLIHGKPLAFRMLFSAYSTANLTCDVHTQPHARGMKPTRLLRAQLPFFLAIWDIGDGQHSMETLVSNHFRRRQPPSKERSTAGASIRHSRTRI